MEHLRRGMSEVKFVLANGLRFAFIEEGDGPLALLLHGFPDTAHTWDAVRPALAHAGFRAVSPFTRGYFPTDVPIDAAYDVNTLGRDVLELITALGASKAIVVGHDWGAAAGY
jgi:pimeloyl-ACP methyl ester carboxylesterase